MPIVFLHIPKTGGSTVADSVNAAYKDLKSVSVHKVYLKTSVVHSDGYRVKPGPLPDMDADFVHGHARFEDVRNVGTLTTVVRHPIDMVCSQYWQWQTMARVSPEKAYPRYQRICRPMGLEEFVAVLETVQNEVPPEGPGFPIRDMPRLASWFLNGAAPKDFKLIGVTGRLQKFVDALSDLLGKPHITKLHMSMAGLRSEGIKARGTPYKIDSSLATRIERLCGADIELYNRFKEAAV